MRRREAPLVRTELALILVGLSLLAPRLTGLGSRTLTAVVPPESARAAVGYAEHRLWTDFLNGRNELLPGRSLPNPTLSEYRQFLAGMGLKRRGDVTSLLVLPGLGEERISDQIEVRLSAISPPLLLKLFVRDSGGQPLCAGQLVIRVDADEGVSCRAEAESAHQLLSFWPVRPGPLLP
jgi:hypothetical protein